MQPSDLISLEEARRAVGACGDEDDALASSFAAVASSIVCAYLGRTLHYRAGITEVVPGYGTPEINVSSYPVIAVTSPAVSGTRSDWRAGVLRSPSGSWAWAPTVSGAALVPVTGHERANYTIVYDAGYQTPNQPPVAGVDPLPPVISYACSQLVGHLAAQSGSSSTVASESLLSYSVSYGAPETTLAEYGGIPARIAALLAPYRRVVIA
jgi:hypothetical protein